MFQFLRRVSGSLLPRPDRPWRDDGECHDPYCTPCNSPCSIRSRRPLATSHAPTIGRKRRYSVTEQDVDDTASTAKRTKNDLANPDTEYDSASDRESTKEDAVPPVEGQDVKEVTKGVKEVDLEDEDKAADPSSIRPEGVPLPDSPSGSPEPESESPELAKSDIVEETKDEEHADDKDSVASSSLEDDAEEGVEDSGRTEAPSVTTNTDTSADETKSGLHDTPETLEVEA